MILLEKRLAAGHKARYSKNLSLKVRYSNLTNSGSKADASNYTEVKNESHGTYGALLFDPRWRSKRVEILERDKHRCILCDSNQSLQVHHRQYHFIEEQQQFKAPWDYADNLLITLCEKCHQRGHRQFKVPTIKI
ncbi:hypothetical protein WG906_08835 [Pedobacter sp. P351]|uniref:hypothetical protein n=1 Tax=Pedobacter superstes TaxID=3133441 RepID=UPI0030B5A95F